MPLSTTVVPQPWTNTTDSAFNFSLVKLNLATEFRVQFVGQGKIVLDNRTGGCLDRWERITITWSKVPQVETSFEKEILYPARTKRGVKYMYIYETNERTIGDDGIVEDHLYKSYWTMIHDMSECFTDQHLTDLIRRGLSAIPHDIAKFTPSYTASGALAPEDCP